MIIERPAVDWLTLTTYDMKAAIEADKIVHSIVGNVTIWEREIDGYEGFEGEGFFFGEGVQKERKHFMLRLWGSLADKYMFHELRPNMDCTKIDLQLTLPWENGNAFPWFYEAIPVLAANEAERKQRGRGLKPLPSPDGWCTQYIGSKSSGKFYRIYMKGEEDDLYIRFEVVYKGKKKLGGKVFERVSENPARMTTHLADEINTLPKECGIVKPFADYLRTITGKPLPVGRERSTPDKTLNWIVKQVMPAFKRMLGNEDTRFTASVLLRDLVDFRENLE